MQGFEFFLKLAVSIWLFVTGIAALGAIPVVWSRQVDIRGTIARYFAPSDPGVFEYIDERKLYQNGEPVADVVDAPVESGGRVLFPRLTNVDRFDGTRPFQWKRLTLQRCFSSGRFEMKSPSGTVRSLANFDCEVIQD